LNSFVGAENHKNLKLSSRTDAGVNAIRNTVHVDLRNRREHLPFYSETNIKNALNNYLNRNQENLCVIDATIIGPVPENELLNVHRDFEMEGLEDSELLKENWFFDCRADATSRQYMYRIICPKFDPQATEQKAIRNLSSKFLFQREAAWLCETPLDIEAMRQGASYLTGIHVCS
jgi:tRNA U38,U39,U40 pseudouridine synthase TruA